MENGNKTEKSKNTLYIVVAVLAVGSLAYRLLSESHLEQSALLFIGLPALITIMVIKFSGTPKSAYGIAFKTITLFLLMSGILLGEGTVCIIMAAPLFYGIAAIVVYVIKKSGPKLQAIAIIPILIFLSEGVNIKKEQSLNVVTVSKVIDGVSLCSLNSSPNFMKDIPAFFSLGFPEAVSIDGSGINIGDSRKIQFVSTTKGIGTLHLRITESTESNVKFEVVSDDTHISHWMHWDKVEISLADNENGTKTVTWTSSYRCALSPSWYFGPLERYAVYSSTHHLIDSYFNHHQE